MDEALAKVVPVGLIAIRLFAILRLQPLWRSAVGVLWTPIALGLAVILAVTLAIPSDAVVGAGYTTWPLLMAFEFLIGSVIGAFAGLPGFALIGAMGASARLLHARARPLVALGTVFGLSVGLQAQLHQPIVRILADFVHAFPPAAPQYWLSHPQFVPVLVGALDGLLALGLALATPVLICVAVVQVAALAIATGPKPAATLALTVRAWGGVSLALLALATSWSVYPESWARAMLVP